MSPSSTPRRNTSAGCGPSGGGGDAAAVDVGGWAALAAGGAGAGAGAGLDIDVSATEMIALGRAFADTRVRTRAVDGALQIGFDGVGLLGSVSLSAAKEMPVIVSLGVSLDIFMGVLMAGLFISRIKSSFEDHDVDTLSNLKD